MFSLYVEKYNTIPFNYTKYVVLKNAKKGSINFIGKVKNKLIHKTFYSDKAVKPSFRLLHNYIHFNNLGGILR